MANNDELTLFSLAAYAVDVVQNAAIDAKHTVDRNINEGMEMMKNPDAYLAKQVEREIAMHHQKETVKNVKVENQHDSVAVDATNGFPTATTGNVMSVEHGQSPWIEKVKLSGEPYWFNTLTREVVDVRPQWPPVIAAGAQQDVTTRRRGTLFTVASKTDVSA